MSGEILAVNHFAQPLLHHGRIDIIVVNPFLIARIVRRIDVYTFDFSGIERKQRLKGD